MKAEQIKQALSPREFYRHELPNAPQWKPGVSGWVDGGRCVFHNDTQPGSFRVNLSSGAFVCFSCGSRGSDVIDFVKLRDGVGFLSAVATIRESWGL